MAVPMQSKGDSIFVSNERVNSELLTMTYGALVMQLIKDYKDVEVVNLELEKMGFNIGLRIIDEFLVKSEIRACTNFAETAQAIAKIGFKMFLGLQCDVVRPSEDFKEFSLAFRGNPLIDFVELPLEYANLHYSNILCGVIRGALSAVQLVVECRYVRSELQGAGESEIRVIIKEVCKDDYRDEDDE